jgi:transposase
MDRRARGRRWIAAATGQEIHPQRGWDYLQKLGFTLEHPRPRHGKADAAAEVAFKKGAAGAAGRATVCERWALDG